MHKKKSKKLSIFKLLFKIGVITAYIGLITILILQALTPGSESSNISNSVGDKLDEIVTDIQKPEAEFVGVESVTFQSLTVSEENLSEDEITLFMGATGKINGKVLPENATNPALVYNSSDSDVIAVYPDGRLQALSLGSAVITISSAENAEINDSVTITVSGIPISGIQITHLPENLRVGQTHRLEITYTPINTTQKEIVWESSDTSILSVDGSGTLTALKDGTATITATSVENDVLIHSVAITVLPPEIIPVEDVKIGIDSAIGYIGESVQLTATISPVDAKDNIIWQSSDESIATISQKGVITYLKAGTVTITAKCSSFDVEDSITITVKEILSKTIVLQMENLVKISENSYGLKEGHVGKVEAILDENATILTVVFTSSDPTIAKISDSGVIEGITMGTVTITATTSYDGESTSASFTLTILDPTIYVESVAIKSLTVSSEILTGTTLSVYIGSTGKFASEVLPSDATNPALSYSSNNTNVVTVYSDGRMQALAVGSAVITLSSQENPEIKHSVTINVVDIQVESIEIKNLPTEFRVDQTHRLEIAYTPANTSQKSVLWKSSDSSVLTVDSSGTITAIKEGNAVVTATSKANGSILHSVTITVLPPPIIPVEEVTIGIESTVGYIGENVQLTATISPAEAKDNLIWQSSNESIATVTQTGKVTYLKAGTVTITAKCSSFDVENSVTITVKEILSKTITLNVTNLNKEGENAYSTAIGLSGQVEAILDENATVLTVVFTSSDPTIAKISEDGVIEGISEGTVTITATTSYDGKSTSASFTLTVKKPHVYVNSVTVKSVTVSSQTLTGDAISVYIGSTGKINSEVLPADATNPALSYSSNNTSVVTVYSDGRIQARAVGTAVITVSSKEDASIKDTFTVTVLDIEVESIEIHNLPTEFRVGQTHKLEIAYTPTNTSQKTVTWNSSDTSVLTVNDSGTITAIKEGNAVVTATSKANGNILHSVAISVLPKYVEPVISVETITIGNAVSEGYIGGQTQLKATLSPADSKDTVTWSSSNESIATVSQTGKVTYLKAGTVTITAKCSSFDVEDSITITVKEVLSKTIKLNVKNLTKINDTAYSTKIGLSGQVEAILDENATVLSVVFTSSNPTIAKISEDGVIEALKVGTVTITASTSYDGETTSASFTLTVEKPHVYVESVAIKALTVSSEILTGTTLSVYIGSTGKFASEVLPSDATNPALSYSSNNTNVVTVYSDGRMQALAVGSAVITLSSQENPEIKHSVTINVVDIQVESIEIKNLPTEFRVDQTHRLEIAYTPANTSQKSVLWKSSDSSVLTVDSSGTITAIKEGNAVVTATSKANGSILHSVTITVLPPPIIPVEEVTIGIESTVGYIGENVQLTATISPAEAKDNLIWQSSNESIATVTQTGKVTYLKAGTVTITAKCSSFDVENSVTITVKEILSKTITLNVTNLNKEGENAYSTAIGLSGQVEAILDENATVLTVVFTSSDPTIAKISEDGVIEGISEGTVTITATTSYDGKSTSASFTLTVKKPHVYVNSVTVKSVTVSSQTLTGDAISVYIGSTGKINSEVLPADATNPALSYSSNNTNIVTVYSDGRIQALAVGSAVITVSSQENPEIKRSVTINVVDIEVESIDIHNLPTEFCVGQTHRLEIAYTPANTSQKGVVWNSSDTSVLTVDNSGTITALKEGNATVTATSKINGNVLHTVTIAVLPPPIIPVNEVKIEIESSVGYIGENVQLTATIFPADAKDSVIWNSSNEKIATISQMGKVTYLKAGTVTITAKCRSYDVENSVTITVKEVLSKAIALKFKNFTEKGEGNYSLKVGSSGKLEAVLDENATILGVTFASSDSTIAKINKDGVIEAIEAGTVTITVSTSYDGETTSTSFILTIESLTFRDTVKNFYYWIRKSIGHFGAFFVLGVLATMSYYIIFPKSTKGKFLGFIICMIAGFAVAGITEILQLPYFTVGRHCSFDDVLLDYSGYCTSSLVMYACLFAWHFLLLLINLIKNKRKKQCNFEK